MIAYKSNLYLTKKKLNLKVTIRPSTFGKANTAHIYFYVLFFMVFETYLILRDTIIRARVA